VDWHIVGALLVGSLPGIYIGSHLAAHIADRFLLPALASALIHTEGAGIVANLSRMASAERVQVKGLGV
jgi:uncharacterized membrane protein YfcA